MAKLAYVLTATAKPGMAESLEQVLRMDRTLAEREPATLSWFAYRIDEQRFGIFATFDDEASRLAHYNGPIAATLMAEGGELLAEPLSIVAVDVLAEK